MTDATRKAIALLDELHAELEADEMLDDRHELFSRIGVVIAILRDGYIPDCD